MSALLLLALAACHATPDDPRQPSADEDRRLNAAAAAVDNGTTLNQTDQP